ncbi:hypothetical protein WSK_1506 [Novosphingobium sp. Rr 2-17]|uniref:hypothetical protein n=1 Tax=Novosphingobium sp. Rr 2-17 TaxID=555793 RepID=UPI00026991D2|nr:hypothetical protein [Novosphingobium sp. Rr 2-17]EIZ79911.1 hypothetical protein WSK_1506 [Novosphingobium sp. Rr 2-17]
MSLSVFVAATMLGQSAFSLGVAQPVANAPDVAYAELSAGEAHAAVTKLEANGAARSDDPATLINLGAAYARAGQPDKAIAVTRAAVQTPIRYDLELADGSWTDSRDAARRALQSMKSARALAAR